MIKVKVRVRIKTSPSLVVAFVVKSLNEIVRVLKPKEQEAKTFGTVSSPLTVMFKIVETNQNLGLLTISQSSQRVDKGIKNLVIGLMSIFDR